MSDTVCEAVDKNREKNALPSLLTWVEVIAFEGRNLADLELMRGKFQRILRYCTQSFKYKLQYIFYVM